MLGEMSMNKIIRSAVVFLLSVLLCVSFMACSEEPSYKGNSVVGKWSQQNSQDGVLEFFSDGTWTRTRIFNGEETLMESGRYKVNGNKFTWIFDDDRTTYVETFIINGDRLDIEKNKFTKIKGGVLNEIQPTQTVVEFPQIVDTPRVTHSVETVQPPKTTYPIITENKVISCSGCTGTGKVHCSYCEEGYVSMAVLDSIIKYTCTFCDGTTKIKCYQCSGSGTIDNSTPDDHDHDYDIPISTFGNITKSTLTCPQCSGMGNLTCTSCNGRGVFSQRKSGISLDGSNGDYYVDVTCPLCSGSGKMMCSGCYGKGVLN